MKRNIRRLSGLLAPILLLVGLQISLPGAAHAATFTISASSGTATVGTPFSGYTVTNSNFISGAAYTIDQSSTLSSTGLTFDIVHGTLSGTPTTALPATAFTITEMSSFGPQTQTFTLTINPASTPTFSLSSSSETATVGTPIVGYTISSLGTPIISYAIAPSVGNGISFDTTTGLLSGTPLVAHADITYTITATDALGIHAFQLFDLTVNPAAPPVLPIFTLSNTIESAVVGTPILGYSINSTGDLITHYSISPAPSNGIIFNSNTGLISGNPTSVAAGNFYSITGFDGSGNQAIQNFTLLVRLPAPTLPAFTLSRSSETVTVGQAIQGYSIISTGDQLVAFTVLPVLPPFPGLNGLAFDPTTGLISGTPIDQTASGVYTITGLDFPLHPATATFTLTVNSSTPPVPPPAQEDSITSFTPTVIAPNAESRITITGNFPHDLTGLQINNKVANLSLSKKGSYTYYVNLPSGLTGSTFTIQLFDGEAPLLSEIKVKVVDAVPLKFTSPVDKATLTGSVGTAFTNSLSTTGGTAPITYSVAPGTLPGGLTLNWATGEISGTPTAPFSGTVVLTATDASTPALTASVSVTISISPWTDQAAAGNRIWQSITSSSDGSHLAAVVYGGGIYTSIDYGKSWNRSTSNLPLYAEWQSITSSSDGSHLAALVYLGGIYTSIDFGKSWNLNISSNLPPEAHWHSITSSSDGSHLAAVAEGGGIYTSIDSGTTWNQSTSPNIPPGQNWTQIVSSSDGSHLATVAQIDYQGQASIASDQIFGSPDSGTTWNLSTSPNLPINVKWFSIASSSDGKKLAAVVYGGGIYTSSDSGTTWAQSTAKKLNWHSIASSGDGKKLAAVVYGGGTYTSSDSGASWSLNTFQNVPTNANWISITSSSGGNHLAAVADGGDIWTYWDGTSDSTPALAPLKFASPADKSTLTGSVGTAFTNTLSTTGGTAPISYSVTPDTLPAGLTLNSATGEISGTPTAPFSSTVVLTATDSSSPALSASISVTINISSWTDQKGAGSRSWVSITSSGDGSHLAAVASGGIYTSINFGKTWNQSTSTNLPLDSHWQSITSSSDGKNLAAVVYEGGIYTSIDFGKSWNQSTSSNLPTTAFWESITSSSDGKNLAAVVYEGGIYTSDDSGTTWSKSKSVNLPSTGTWNSIASSSDGSRLAVVAHAGGIYTSSNYGNDWNLSTSTNLPLNADWQSITSSSDGSHLAAATSGDGIYTSIDSGMSWNPSPANLPPNVDWRSITSSSDGSHLAAVTLNGGIYSSSNSGARWSLSTSQNLRILGYLYSITSSSDGSRLAAAALHGDIWTYWDGTSNSTPALAPLKFTSPTDKTTLTASVRKAFVSTLHVNRKKVPIKFALTAGTLPGGLSLNPTTGVISGTPTAPARSTVTLTATDKSSPALSASITVTISISGWTDQINAGSNTWHAITSSSDGIHLAAVADTGNGKSGIYTSDDSGTTWSKSKSVNLPSTGTWNSIASSSDGSHLAAVADEGGIYTSIDFGKSWNQSTSSNLPTVAQWRSITSSSDGSHLAIVALGGGIYTSSDSGNTWSEATNGLPAKADWLSITSSSDGSYLAAVILSGGIYTSNNSGASWSEETKGLPATPRWFSIASSSDGKKLVAATAGDGIYTSSDSGNTWSEATTGLPTGAGWLSITSSSDGTRLAVVAFKAIYTSSDSGSTWSQSTSSNLPKDALWYSITASSDGTRLATVPLSGDIWTYGDSN